MKIKALIESKKDIRFIDIPIQWQDSFRTFMFGQTYYCDDEGNKMMYIHDFIRWYCINQVAIDREVKIDNIIELEELVMKSI